MFDNIQHQDNVHIFQLSRERRLVEVVQDELVQRINLDRGELVDPDHATTGSLDPCRQVPSSAANIDHRLPCLDLTQRRGMGTFEIELWRVVGVALAVGSNVEVTTMEEVVRLESSYGRNAHNVPGVPHAV